MLLQLNHVFVNTLFNIDNNTPQKVLKYCLSLCSYLFGVTWLVYLDISKWPQTKYIQLQMHDFLLLFSTAAWDVFVISIIILDCN